MATIDYRLAAPRQIEMQFNDGAGDPIVDADFKFGMQVDGVCETINGVLSGELYQFDMATLDLTAQSYPVNIYTDSGDGWVWISEFELRVLGGC